nr:FUSC family protein [Pseudonocardia acidicola]
MAVAGGLAILLGEMVSPTRYYWAVLAAFLAFTGTSTRSETVAKAFNRVLGTLIGLAAAILLADLTAGNTPAILAVILVSVFAAFYLFTVNYALMVFFVTIMVAEMYDVLHQFSDQLLLLRLTETAVGAAVGIVVALILVPTSTRDTARAARTAVLGALAELLGATARRIRPETRRGPEPDATPSDLGELARTLDDRLRQLALVARPLTWPVVLGNDPGRIRDRLRLYEDCGISARSLTMWLRRHSEPAPPELADAAQALGDAAGRLAEVGTYRPDREVHEHLARADSMLLQATRPGAAAAVHPATRPLVRLHELLHEVSAAVPADALPVAPRAVAPRPADARLGGTVRTADGEPVTAGSVTVIDGSGQQAAHAELAPDGTFRVPGRLAGPHVLVASAPGYTSAAVRLQLGGNTPRRVDLVVHPAPRLAAPRRPMRSGQCSSPAAHGPGERGSSADQAPSPAAHPQTSVAIDP